MIVSSSQPGVDWFLNGLANLERRQVKTQRQISSGYQIEDASDSPEQTQSLIDLGSRLATIQSYQANLGRVQAETNVADQALGNSITLIESARTAAVQGANSTSTATARQALGVQIGNIQQQLVSLTNTT